MKKYSIIVLLLVVAGAVVFNFMKTPAPTEKAVSPKDYRNISYNIEGKNIELINGLNETETMGSSEIVTTKYFGNEAKADFNNDGMEDVAFLLTQSGEGTGIFYYVAVALKNADGYTGTNAVFIGDRIAPQTTNYMNGKIVVNYADRKPGEPMTARPSVGVSKYLGIEDGRLIEVK